MDALELIQHNKKRLATASEKIALLDKPSLDVRAIALAMDEQKAEVLRQIKSQMRYAAECTLEGVELRAPIR